MTKEDVVKNAKKDWRFHQRNAWMFFAFLMFIGLVFMGIGARFLKPQGVIFLLAGFAALQAAIFVYSDKIVRVLMECEEPAGAIQERLNTILDLLLPKTGLKHRPHLYVSNKTMPNAFAFGTGFGSSSIAVTKPICDLLDDDELAAVIGHELGHIRSRDTAAMTLVSISLSLMSNIADKGRHIGKLANVFAVFVEIAVYVPRVVASGLSQLREFAADAYSVSLLGTGVPLISAFDKMEKWYKTNKTATGLEAVFKRRSMDELQLSHPDMSQRKAFLRQIEGIDEDTQQNLFQKEG